MPQTDKQIEADGYRYVAIFARHRLGFDITTRQPQTLLEQQQAQTQASQLSLAEQRQILAGILQPHTQDTKQVPIATTLP